MVLQIALMPPWSTEETRPMILRVPRVVLSTLTVPLQTLSFGLVLVTTRLVQLATGARKPPNLRVTLLARAFTTRSCRLRVSDLLSWRSLLRARPRAPRLSTLAVSWWLCLRSWNTRNTNSISISVMLLKTRIIPMKSRRIGLQKLLQLIMVSMT